MEYINIINDNSNVIINDNFRNLSIINSYDTPWQKGFMPPEWVQYTDTNLGSHHEASKNHNELIFVSPNGGNSFNKAFSQTNLSNKSILFTPCGFQENVLFHGSKAMTDRNGKYLGPFIFADDINDTHSFKILKFGERFPSGRYGVEVYNKNGAMIFTSNNRYLKIKDFIFIPNYLRQFFEVRNGATRPKNNITNVVSSRWYSSYDWYAGVHCHFKRYSYDEPIAICALNLPSPDIMLNGTQRNQFSNGFVYLSFANEYTLDILGELNSRYIAYEGDTTGEGENSPYAPTSEVHQQRTYRGNCDTLALMVIAKNDYL